MSPEMAEYIVVGVIISVIVNVVLMKIWKLFELIRRRNEERNRPRHVPDTTQAHGSPRSIPSRRSNGSNSQNVVRDATRQIRNAPPPIPTHRVDMTRRDRDTFPRCPICRSSNRPGKAQKIFWDSNNSRWRCVEGHSFSS